MMEEITNQILALLSSNPLSIRGTRIIRTITMVVTANLEWEGALIM
jgi:hypothetical protein